MSQSGGDDVSSVRPAIGGNGRMYGIAAQRDYCPRGQICHLIKNILKASKGKMRKRIS